MKKIMIASGPVIVEDGKVLLDQHGDTNFWKFCGGRAEDETEGLKNIAMRKAKEELGIEIEVLNEVPFFLYTEKETPEGKVDVILVHYLAKRVGEVQPSAEVREWKWIPMAELEKENLAPNILPTLKHFNILAS